MVDITRLNKISWILSAILIIFFIGFYLGSYYSGKHLEQASNENRKLNEQVKELNSQVARQTKKIADLEGIGG